VRGAGAVGAGGALRRPGGAGEPRGRRWGGSRQRARRAAAAGAAAGAIAVVGGGAAASRHGAGAAGPRRGGPHPAPARLRPRPARPPGVSHNPGWGAGCEGDVGLHWLRHNWRTSTEVLGGKLASMQTVPVPEAIQAIRLVPKRFPLLHCIVQ